MLNRPELSVVISPTVKLRPDDSARPRLSGVNPSCSAARRTRSLVSSRSWPVSFSAFDAVLVETPASAATSVMRGSAGPVDAIRPLPHNLSGTFRRHYLTATVWSGSCQLRGVDQIHQPL